MGICQNNAAKAKELLMTPPVFLSLLFFCVPAKATSAGSSRMIMPTLRHPTRCFCQGSDQDLPARLIDCIYANLNRNHRDAQYIMERATLCSKNQYVDLINIVADAFPGERIVYLARDSITDCESEGAATYPPEFLNSLNAAGMPPFKLRLKVHQPVILLRNFDPQNGLCNGTRLIMQNPASQRQSFQFFRLPGVCTVYKQYFYSAKSIINIFPLTFSVTSRTSS